MLSMAQVIRDNDLTSLLGQQFGTGIGKGLDDTVGTSIRSLLQSKLKEIESERMYDRLGKSYEQMGLPNEFARLPERAQAALLNELSPMILNNITSGRANGAQGVQGMDALAQLLQSPQARQQSPMQQDMQSPMQQQPMQENVPLNKSTQPSMQQQVMQQQGMPLTKTQQAQRRQDELLRRQDQREIEREERKDLRLRQKEERDKAQFAEKEERKESWEAQKMYKDDYKTVTDAASTARNQNKDLDRMMKLIDKNNLNSRAATAIADRVKEGFGFKVAGQFIGIPGINLDFLYKTPDTEEFEKLSANFIRGAKDIFGARITNADLEAYNKMIPTMMQSDEGKKRIIQSFMVANKGILARYDAAQEILRENKGIFPKNFNYQLEERVAPKLDAIIEEFKKRYSDTSDNNEVDQDADAYKAIQEYAREII